MMNMFRKLWNDDRGFVVTVELVLVATILVIGLVTGFAMLRDAVLAELGDTAQAVGAIDQSWAIGGSTYGDVAEAGGSSFADATDASDLLDADGVPVVTSGAGITVIDAATGSSTPDTNEGA